jgi:hypothetical protein
VPSASCGSASFKSGSTAGLEGCSAYRRATSLPIISITIDGERQRLLTTYQTATPYKECLANLSIEPSRGSCVGRTLLEAKVAHIPGIRKDAE